MEITMLGHASLTVKTADITILMDPVLWDPHQNGLFDVCPKREIDTSKLPEFDCIVISHKHLDHFDVRSLTFLRKDKPVIIPKDPLLKEALGSIGFSKVHPINDFTDLKWGTTKLFSTHSENNVPEFGIVFSDPDGVFWNQVDTEVSDQTIRMVTSHVGTVDLVLASWQPMLETNFQTNKSLDFPFERYEATLRGITGLAPRFVAPGANAFRYRPDCEWLNRIVFPLTRERFCDDAKAAHEQLEGALELDPGDVVVLEHGQPTKHVQASPFVSKVLDDREDLQFVPVDVGSTLKDPEESGTFVDDIQVEIENRWPVRIAERIHSFQNHRKWGGIYQIEVIGRQQINSWWIDFSKTPVTPVRGRNPRSNMFTYIAASVFSGLINKTQGWDYALLGGFYRHHAKVYRVNPLGLMRPKGDEIRDPMEIFYPYGELFKEQLDAEIRKWADSTKESVQGMAAAG